MSIEEPFVDQQLMHQDVSTLFVPAADSPSPFIKGVVQAWDPAIRRGVVLISGTAFTDLSVLDTVALATLLPGDVVLVLKMTRSWLIVGRILDPI